MDKQTLVDTDLLIDFLRGTDTSILELQETGISISTITALELYFGAQKSEQAEKNTKHVDELLQRVHIHDFDATSAQRAAQIHAELSRNGEPIDIRDLFIAATAITNNLELRTNNTKHFSRIPELKLSAAKNSSS